MSFRTRLSLVLGGLVLVLVATTSLVIYQTVRVNLDRQIDRFLTDRVSTVAQRLSGPLALRSFGRGERFRVPLGEAEFLAERGRTVTVLEEGDKLGVEMAHPRRARALHEARTHGVTFVTGATLTEIGAKAVTYTVGDETRTADAQHVIFATGVHGDTALADALTARGIEVHVVGDAGAVGYIQNAVATGNAVARAL